MVKPKFTVTIYGGNGFVGTHIAEQLADEQDLCVCCVSRTGHKPLYLHGQAWGEKVRWCKGDASNPDVKLLAKTDVLITTVGAPPLPTFSDQAYQQQLLTNGTVNVQLISAALEQGVQRIIVLGAHIPALLRRDSFAYAKGKQQVLDAAVNFAKQSPQHSALVLQPGAIYGKRHLGNGKVIPLDWLMKPLACVLRGQFNDVNKISARVVEAIHNRQNYLGLTVLRPKQI